MKTVLQFISFLFKAAGKHNLTEYVLLHGTQNPGPGDKPGTRLGGDAGRTEVTDTHQGKASVLHYGTKKLEKYDRGCNTTIHRVRISASRVKHVKSVVDATASGGTARQTAGEVLGDKPIQCGGEKCDSHTHQATRRTLLGDKRDRQAACHWDHTLSPLQATGRNAGALLIRMR